MKTYKLLQTVMLSFTTPQDQYEALFDPSDTLTLECDGSTIWLCTPGEREETITSAHAIDVWVESGIIEEKKGANHGVDH